MSKRKRQSKKYPLDSSAIIHLASMRKEYTNSFRIDVTLTEIVCPSILQKALEHISPRFPTIVAGIRKSFFRYFIIPAPKAPQVEREREYLACMSKDMIRTCAMRILYHDNQIILECFHALTDGYGGMVFLKTLVEEYIALKDSVSRQYSEEVLNPYETAKEWEVSDDFLNYVGENSISANHQSVYRLQGSTISNTVSHVTTLIYNTQEILDAAHYFNVSLTVFLTAAMFDAIMEIQKNDMTQRQAYKPVQLMVPINLRKRFASKTLRNFSLYALPCIVPSKAKESFDSLIRQVAQQMEEQTAKKQLSAMITTNVHSQNWLLFRVLPLPIKNIVLRLVYHFYGERNSCLSISNLGDITFPEVIQPYIQRVDFSLTPRRNAPYNCGVASYNGESFIKFTNKNTKTELEQYFFKCLDDMGYPAKIESE